MNARKYTIIRTFPEGNPASNYRNVKVRHWTKSFPHMLNHIYIISFLCGILALFSAFLVSYTMESIDLLMLLIFGLILLIPICVLLYFFKRITEIALIIFSVYCLLFLVLLFVDLIILPYIRWNINLIIVNIPLNMIISVLLVIPILIIWYYLTQRYFWFRIKANNNQQ